jgi:predicted alpha/beta hydrolase
MARSTRNVRRSHAPRASFEELEIRTEDGASLRATVDDPPEGVALRGTCVMAHAMGARRSEFGRRDRPGLAQAYAQRGWRTVAFDFRGHGESAVPKGRADWRYDDLVRFDMPTVVECARARGEDRPVVVIGHAMGGHVALAAQGTGRMAADGLVVIACNLWLRQLETSRLRWVAKLAAGRVMAESLARMGRLPVRRMRLGSDDVSGPFVRDLLRFLRDDRWTSEDGVENYLASLGAVTAPVSAVASEGDVMICHPASAELFARRCGGPLDLVRVARSDDGRRAPGHMALVTTSSARVPLLAALAWVESKLAGAHR